ncbi:MAG TPA: YceI family protein [Gaiellales bacterium]|nr:YceI family protein [Gaiellales bacterium]
MSTMETTSPAVSPTEWTVDPAHSTVEFAVKTFWGAMTVHGRFERFEGSYRIGPDGPSIELDIDAGSLDTGHPKRDAHLRSSDFFTVEQHPHVRFRSTRVDDVGEGRLHVQGTLEAAGTVVPMEFDATAVQAGDRLQVEAATVIDPRNFNMSRGMLNMIRPAARVHVKAHLSERQSLQTAA